MHFLKESGAGVPPYFSHIRGCSATRDQITIDWMWVKNHNTGHARFMHPPFSRGGAGYPQAAIRPRLHVDNLLLKRPLADAINGKDPNRNQPKSNEEELTNELQFA